MTENKPYMPRAGYYHNFTGICKDKGENLTTIKVCNLLNEKDKRIKELEKENERLKADNKGYHSNYEKLKDIPVLFVSGVPYVSVQEIHKWVELVVLREKERIDGDVE